MPKQLAHGGQPDPVHDALRGVGVAGVVEPHAAQSGLLPDPDPERVEARRGEVLGEHSRPAFRPGQRRKHLDGIAREWADLHGEVLPGLIDDRAAIGLHAEEHANGNELYSVFDEILPGEKEWRTDSTVTRSSGTIELQVPAIALPVPIAEARVLKRAMRIAAMIRPKAPYFAIATSFPLSSRGPTTTRILIADILCVAITDQEGRILKIVERAQGH